MVQSLRILMDGLIDYAGLFPPASHDMRTAVRNFSAYARSSESAWLGRFVVTVARLREFSEAEAEATLDASEGSSGAASGNASAAAPEDPGTAGAGGAPSPEAAPVRRPWRLSVLIGESLAADLARIEGFHREAESRGPRAARVDALEMKAARPDGIAAAMAIIPAGLTPYFEIPPKEDPAPWLDVLSATGGRAKLRTGGVTPDLIPDPAEVARFLAACARARVPFKATAGLHHPFRSRRGLTYAPDGPAAVMHGFLNVFLAAAFAAEGAGAGELAELLREEDPRALRFGEDGAAWRDRRIARERLEAVRREFAVGFGSCSFLEPRQDLEEAKLL